MLMGFRDRPHYDGDTVTVCGTSTLIVNPYEVVRFTDEHEQPSLHLRFGQALAVKRMSTKTLDCAFNEG